MHNKDPVMVPHLLPDQAQLKALISDLPLRLHSYVDEEHLYIATLQVHRLHISWLMSLAVGIDALGACLLPASSKTQSGAASWAQVQSSFAL